MSLSNCKVQTNDQGRELVEHGSALFPIACYKEDIALEPVPWHWHDEWEAIIIREGYAVISIGSEKYKVMQGEGIFINSGILHAVCTDETSKCNIHSIVFQPRLVGGSMDSIFWQKYVQPLLQNSLLKGIYLDGSTSWHQKIIDAVETSWTYVVSEQDGHEFQVRDTLSQMIFLLNKHCPFAENPPSEKELRNAQRIKTMLQYIQDHYSEELNTYLIAQSIMVSESECLRCFHNTIGTTPIQYLKQFRIQKAADMLLSTNKKSGDIGAECGFGDTSYFTKTFREIKGCTPGEYRKKNIS